MSPTGGEGFFDRVYDAVRQVPSGRVTTYGEVAERAAGRPGGARTVGWALRALPPEMAPDVPWWRVINAQGGISTSSDEHSLGEQRTRLEAEDVVFGDDGRVDLERYGWWFE